MIVKDFLKRTHKGGIFILREWLVCKDGFRMSVQASKYHYCNPRDTIADGEYESVEVGYPSHVEELLIQYAEDKYALTGTVYAYVPIELVEQVIEKHGGLE